MGQYMNSMMLINFKGICMTYSATTNDQRQELQSNCKVQFPSNATDIELFHVIMKFNNRQILIRDLLHSLILAENWIVTHLFSETLVASFTQECSINNFQMNVAKSKTISQSPSERLKNTWITISRCSFSENSRHHLKYLDLQPQFDKML